MGGCRNWSRRSGPQNLDQIWTKSGHHLDRFLKNGCQHSPQDTLPTYEGINFGFRFVWEIQILSIPRLRMYKGRRNLGPFLKTMKKKPFVCTFAYKQRNEPIGPFLSCSMCIYICRKMRSGLVQNDLDQSRIWTACPDMLSRFFDLDSHVPLSGPDLDQIWTKSGIRQKPSGPILATIQCIFLKSVDKAKTPLSLSRALNY
jgi:hypothetical protein